MKTETAAKSTSLDPRNKEKSISKGKSKKDTKKQSNKLPLTKREKTLLKICEMERARQIYYPQDMNTKFQNIFRNIKIHEICITILEYDLDLSQETPSYHYSQKQNEMIRKVYQLLSFMCYNQPSIQYYLTKYLSIFKRHIQ